MCYYKLYKTKTKDIIMQLSNQALGAVMLALQNSLMNQTDIVPVLKEFNFTESNDGLRVENPPVVNMTEDDATADEANQSTVFQAYVDELDGTPQ